MTDERPLNVRIAEARGWTTLSVLKDGNVLGVKPGADPSVLLSYANPPAYGLAWAGTGPLLEEMARHFDRVRITNNGVGGVTVEAMGGDVAMYEGVGEDEREAIGETWLAWKRRTA